MSKTNKEIQLIAEFKEDWTKCAMKYGKEIEEITQEEWRDYFQSKLDEKSEQRRKEGMTNPKKPHIKYLWDEERMQWYTDMKAYKKHYYETKVKKPSECEFCHRILANKYSLARHQTKTIRCLKIQTRLREEEQQKPTIAQRLRSLVNF